MKLSSPLQLAPEYRDYVWGGQRLRPGQRTAEAWVVHEHNRVAAGPLAGRTLADLAGEYGPALLGQRVWQRTGARFPLLIKLLDCAQWLSVQVHPNDAQAEQLEGPGHFGKTEAWHVLAADETAQLIAGVKPGVTAATLAEAIRQGTIATLAQYQPLQAGDTFFIRPGTLHALGPGLLIYEIQQTSDLTYRVFDWNRPQTAGRALHIDKSLAVADPAASVHPVPRPALADGERTVLSACPYFTLELLAAHTVSLELAPRGETFHILTLLTGAAQVVTENATHPLRPLETLVIPADSGPYQLIPQNQTQVLKASVE